MKSLLPLLAALLAAVTFAEPAAESVTTELTGLSPTLVKVDEFAYIVGGDTDTLTLDRSLNGSGSYAITTNTSALRAYETTGVVSQSVAAVTFQIGCDVPAYSTVTLTNDFRMASEVTRPRGTSPEWAFAELFGVASAAALDGFAVSVRSVGDPSADTDQVKSLARIGAVAFTNLVCATTGQVAHTFVNDTAAPRRMVTNLTFVAGCSAAPTYLSGVRQTQGSHQQDATFEFTGVTGTQVHTHHWTRTNAVRKDDSCHESTWTCLCGVMRTEQERHHNADGVCTACGRRADEGVLVNGLDVFNDTGAGWTYADGTLTLDGSVPMTLSGTNTEGLVQVLAKKSAVVTLSNLVLRATDYGQCAFRVAGGATVSLILAGGNEFESGADCAGLQVEEGSALAITNAAGDFSAALRVQGGDWGAGIGGGANGSGGAVTISDGTVTVQGGDWGAGIGGGDGGSGGTVTISGGTVTAGGGDYGAGIGGGDGGSDGTVTISGGTVTAQGGNGAAGIGGGEDGSGGTVTISCGMVTAQGGNYGAGIGGGDGRPGGTVTISGGTVMARGGSLAAGIGGGVGGSGGAVTIAGGSVKSENGGDFDAALANVPSNGAARVWCVTVGGLAPNAPITLSDFSLQSSAFTYGTSGIVSDGAGSVYLWLPNGEYAFTADGAAYEAVVNDNHAAAVGMPRIVAARADGGVFRIAIANAVPNAVYGVLSAPTPAGPYAPTPATMTQTGAAIEFAVPMTDPARFYKISATPAP